MGRGDIDMSGQIHRSKSAMVFIMNIFLLLVLWVHLLLPGYALSEKANTAARAKLRKIRGWYHEDYSSIVLQFDRRVDFEPPVIEKKQVFIRLRTVETDLAAVTEFKELDSWVALEKAGEDLNVKIGLPKNFTKLAHYRFIRPFRLFIKLYKGKPTAQPVDDNQALETIGAATTTVTEETQPEHQQTQAPGETTKIDKPADPPAGDKAIDTENKVNRITTDGLLTLNFFQSDIQEVISALAMEREINIVTAQDVSGSISVHLHRVTLDEALDAITLAGGFSYHKYDDLYYIYKPKKTFDPQEKKLEMKIFKLKYVEMDRIQEILQGLPHMGIVQIHKPSKTLIVEDTPENIKKIETIIRHWDREPKQVMIEAKILEISLTDDMAFGVDWSKMLGEFDIGTSGFSRAVLPSNEPVSPTPSEGSGVFSNLITAIGTDKQFAMALDALQSKTKINTISTPKVFAIHGKPAKVQVGGQQGYRVTTTSLGVATETIEFIDTGTILEITPYIDDEGGILLQVLPSITDAKLDQGIPVTRTTSVSTWVMAKDGQTIFIGGLIQNRKEKTREAVPCLGGIDGLGALFGRTTSSLDKTELIFLITPRIFDGKLTEEDLKALRKTRKIEEKFEKEPLAPVKQVLEFISPVHEEERILQQQTK